MNRVTTILLLILVISNGLFAQTDSTSNQGEIVSGEVIIEKNKEITLPKADKFYQHGKLKTFDSEPIKVDLTSFEPNLQWPPYKSNVPFEKVNTEYPQDEYPNYVRLGYGNYGSPLAEVGIFETVGSFDLKNKLFYESFSKGPVNEKNSANGFGMLDLSGTYSTENLEITPYIGYSHRSYRFYGNTNRSGSGFTSEELPMVSWSNFSIGTHLAGKTETIKYSFKPEFNSTSQKPEDVDPLNKENVIGATGSFDFIIDDQFSTGFNLEGYSSNYEGGLSYDRSLLLANPWLEYKNENFLIKAGIQIASGKTDQEDKSGIYPDLRGELFLDNSWKVIAHVSGGIDWRDVNQLLSENEFLDDSLQILNQINKISFGGGLKGNLLSNLVLDVDLTFSDIENLPFYVPSSTDSSRYTITFDSESIQRLRLKSQLTYSPTNASLYGASLEINSYSTSLDRPWHLPTFIFKAYTSHNIKQKVIISGSLLTMGGIRAPTSDNFGIEELKAFLDIGFKANYLINDRASIFIDTQNLLNNEYERYLGYPVRGATFKIGGQYRF